MDSIIANLKDNFSYEQLAQAMYLKGEGDGYPKVTDKTKWRELVMAEKLQHVAFKKISAGKNSDKYGADAYEADGKTAEYKSQAIDDKEVRNLKRQIKNPKNGSRYAALKVSGVYNGAYNQEAIDSYAEHNHYFGVFSKERCVLIVKPKTEYVIEALTENNQKRKPGATTNCNTVKVDLEDATVYETVFKDEEWFKENK